MNIITAKIDCIKIEKARLFAGKNGAKYLDIVLIPTENDRYGNDFMVVQAVSKQEREAGERGPILGNAKYMGQNREANPDRKIDPADVPKQKTEEFEPPF